MDVWSAWSSWSECSSTCSNGTRKRFRICLGPLSTCYGKYMDVDRCNASMYPGS